MRRLAISASLMCADLGALREELLRLEAAGIDRFHWDVMDGHFVPNLVFGPDTIRSIREATRLPFEAHLMVEAPEALADAFVEAGVNRLIVHVEACRFPVRLARHLHSRATTMGVALNPATDEDALRYLLPYVDQVLVMTVEPGYAGQVFVEATLEKVERVNAVILGSGRRVELAVDGNVSPENVGALVKAGATVCVAGTSSVFRSPDYAENLRQLKAALAASTG